MPNKNIHAINAMATTYRSNSPTAFFDTPKDATPQDCKGITGVLLNQAYYVLSAIDLDADKPTALAQIEVVSNLLLQAKIANDALSIEKAISMAQLEG